MGSRMEQLLRVMRREALKRLEEERKKRKEIFWIRLRMPALRSFTKGVLERQRRVV